MELPRNDTRMCARMDLPRNDTNLCARRDTHVAHLQQHVCEDAHGRPLRHAWARVEATDDIIVVAAPSNLRDACVHGRADV
eukprot:351929-Chlamydomonas_euryale.AAC.9